MRSDYDEIKKEFITPYNFVGGYKQSGYRDDVGTEARMNNPCQGVFVKNPDYTGEEDGDLREVARFRDVSGLVYDDVKEMFYVHDQVGHTIRTISMEQEENVAGDENIPEDESTVESNE